MRYQSVLMTHADGGMHHLGVKAEDISENVILTPDPMMVEYYAKYMENPVMKGDYREYVTYTGTYNGKPLTVMSCGFGCMPMAIAIEELKHIGGKNVIKIDTNVSIQNDINCGDIVVAKGAVRGEGASREYIDISYPAVANMELLSNVIDINKDIKIGLFRSHDVENLETPYAPNGMQRINHWQQLGVDVVDAETSSMYIVGSCLKVNVLSISLIKENYVTNTKLEKNKLDEYRKKLFDIAANTLTK